MKILTILLLLSVAAYSQDFSRYNLSVTDSSVESGQNLLNLESHNGKSLEVAYSGELSSRMISLVGSVYDTLISWRELELKKARIVFEGNKMNIIIIPTALTYNDVELSQYMPSGMQFYYEKFFEYDFRMFKDSLFMRLKGQYFSKDEFLEDIYNAVQDPILYIQIHDPSYLIRQIDQLRDTNSEQSKNIFVLQEDLSTLLERHEELLSRHEELLETHTTLEGKHDDLNTRHETLKGNHETLKENHETLRSEKETLDIENKKLTSAVISLNNRNFFGILNQHDQTIIDKTIELKKSNPNITVKEMITKLKELGLKPQTKVVESIFMIYFAEFPQNK